ncbi:cytochrome P450 [Antrihabitans cavernicola]|uniref:Cytochrome P450 n=1 Tax=Antrihabitans cavernicola TaxID=2495913 RepID=A0A5A7SH69_9NOCA|nr:cytochrome P450 [Spelaeibacter cavernicola]KAA0024057.1 cytochrome P450 [Spelaeibacter cavernicola]
MKQQVRWAATQAVLRAAARYGVRKGDPQARLIADPRVLADPTPYFEELRAQGPLVRGRVAFITVDHHVAHDLLRSEDFHVVNMGRNLPRPLRWVEEHTRGGVLHPLQPPSLLAVEPPTHTRYRKTVSSVFTPRAVAALGDRVETAANSLLDEIDGRAGAVDIVEHYCARLPVAIIGDILGVPEHDRPRILEFGELAAPSLDIGLSWPQYQRVQRGLEGFGHWLTSHLNYLRRNPGDNLMSQLIQKSDAGAHLTDVELQATAGLVLAAGFETTVNLLGNGIDLLLASPDQRQMLSDRPELWSNAVEEILRMESPVQISARVARTDRVIAGTPVQRGEMVVISLAGANRDPSVFDHPANFDVERSNANKHLSFSAGRHFCLGAALARAEGEVGLRTFFERFPDVAPAGKGTRRETRVLHGWASLPVTLA